MMKTKQRIAIQMYGNLRTFDKTYKSLFANIINCNKKYFDFDIFLHTWNKVDNEDVTPHYKKVYIDECTDKAKVESIYKPKKFLIQDRNIVKIDDREIKSLEKKIISQEEKNFINSQGGIKRCYKRAKTISHSIYQVNKLRINSQNKYDFVILTRPDILFYKELDLSNLFNGKMGWEKFDTKFQNYVFLSHMLTKASVQNFQNVLIGADLFCFSTPVVMDKLTSYWEDIIEKPLLSTEKQITYNVNKNNFNFAFINYLADHSFGIRRRDSLRIKRRDSAWKLIHNYLADHFKFYKR